MLDLKIEGILESTKHSIYIVAIYFSGPTSTNLNNFTETEPRSLHI